MYRMMSEIATIQYEADAASMLVQFEKEGDIKKYEATIKMAQPMAASRNTNKWLFIKQNFADVNTDHFLLFMNKCYQHFSCLSDKCRLAVYTKPQAFEKLMMKYRWLKRESSSLSLGIFSNQAEAYLYLTQENTGSSPLSFC